MTPEQRPFAWATHHDEPMLFPTRQEAAGYCDEDEEPIPLYTHPAPAVDVEALMADLPKLPLPNTEWQLHMPARPYEPEWTSNQAGYDSEQMHDYARAALRAALEGLKA